jgi:hypothetical protein
MLAFSIAFYWCPGRHLLKHMLTRLTLGKVLRATLKQSSTSSLTQTVAELRASRTSSATASSTSDTPSTADPAGDMVYENVLLFLRDALITREFTDSIKCGDSGRVLLVLKTWALSFRGSGRTKYAHEMLHLIHNLEHVWPKPIRYVMQIYQTLFATDFSSSAMILNNWLINPTGRLNSWVEVDLMQDFWIKVCLNCSVRNHKNCQYFRLQRFYAAHGSSASWDWLEMIVPCVDVLWHLSRMMHNILGSDQGTKHEPPNLKK